MAKYSQKLVDRICSLIREDSYTIAEICDLVGINKDTYYTWMKTKSDFSDSIKKAEDARMQFFVAEAQKSLLKKIQRMSIVVNLWLMRMEKRNRNLRSKRKL